MASHGHESGIPQLRTWLSSDRFLARRVGQPLAAFLHVEAAGGILLVLATVAALVWANGWPDSYTTFWSTEAGFAIGSFEVVEPLQAWVADLLMAVFFLVVGLEVKRELIVGELRDRRTAALPAIAALGGMVVPALIYAAFNAGGPGADGWGIPMATDIAFAVGVVALLGRRVPASLKLFLLSLAIVDDIGAILVIAVFYTDDLSWAWLAAAAAAALAMWLLRLVRVRYTPVFVVLGLFLWLATLESGVHATIAGVVIGLLTPVRPLQPEPETEAIVDTLENRPELTAEDVHRVALQVKESVSVGERAEWTLHPWASYVVVPVFALSAAGITLGADSIDLGSGVFLGVLLGLVVGKLVGISVFSWLAVRFGVARLPAGVSWPNVVGVAALGGIGFTVSLFIASLAFDDQVIVDEAKSAVLVASVVASVVGAALTVVAARRSPRHVRSPDGHSSGDASRAVNHASTGG
jgi:NhaA family Na+:H+ antiporter